MKDDLYFESIREDRGYYFVEYQPPVADHSFATLNLIFPESISWERVSELLDKEVREWIGRYRVPLMVWALDNKEDAIRPPDRDANCLVAWNDPESGQIVKSWDHRDLTAYLKKAPQHPDWRTIYADIPVRTDAEVKAAAHEKFSERRRWIRWLKIVFMLWLAMIPAGYAIFEFLGPEWLGYFGLAFVLWKALKAALQIWGRTEPSVREKGKAERQRRMDHYYYHCERNPRGFERLKVENLQNDAREQVRWDAEDLARRTDR